MDLKNDDSLKDSNLDVYFNNKRIRRHLIRAGLINRHGDIIPPPSYEVVLNRRTKRKQARERLSRLITSHVIEDERKRQAFIFSHFDLAMKRSRIIKMRELNHFNKRSMSNSLNHIAKRPSNRNARTPSPVSRKRSPGRAKSAHHPPKNVRNLLARRPVTGKQPSADENCQVTMIYYESQAVIDRNNTWAQPNGDEIIVMQQHCGGENLMVFKGFVKANETFTFESRRHQEYPFALALYVNGLIDSRISVCCEYKHKCNVRLGSKHGLFGMYDVQKSQPCRSCRFEKRMQKVLSTSSVSENSALSRRPIAPRTTLKSVFGPGALLRTPSASPEKKGPSKVEPIHISTVAQASRSPRISSAASSQSMGKTDEPKNNIPLSAKQKNDKSSSPAEQSIEKKKKHTRKSSKSSSSSSIQLPHSTPITPIKKDDASHPAEQSLTKKNDYTRSTSSASSSSTQSLRPAPIIPSKKDDASHPADQSLTKKNDYTRSTSSSSSTSTQSLRPAPIIPSKKDDASHSAEQSLTKKNDYVRSTSSASSTSTQSLRPTPITPSKKDNASHSTKQLLIRKNDYVRSTSSASSTASKSNLAPIPVLQNEHDRHPSKILPRKKTTHTRLPSSSSSEVRRSPIPRFDEEKHSPTQLTGKNKANKKPSPSISSRSDSAASNIPHKNDNVNKNDDEDDIFSSSSSITLAKSDNSLNDFFSTGKDNQSSKLVTGKINVDEKSISNTSKKSRSSSKKEDGVKSSEANNYPSRHLSISSSTSSRDDHSSLHNNQTEKVRHLSTPPSETSTASHHSVKNEPKARRSSTLSVEDRPPVFNNQNEEVRHLSISSSESTIKSHHSVKSQPESHRSSTASTKNQKGNGITTPDPLKATSDTDLNNDDIKPKAIVKKKLRNHNESDNESDGNEPITITHKKSSVRQYRPVENIIVVWLDDTVDDNDNKDTKGTKTQLREIARTIRSFSDPKKCIELIKEVKTEKVFLIVSGKLSEDIIQEIGTYSQLAVVYIFCQQKIKYEHLAKQYPKVKGIYTDIETICEHLKSDSKQWDNDFNTFQTSSLIYQIQLNSDQLLFIQNQLFKEYLLEMKYDDDIISDLIEYCQKLYRENEKELKLIEEFEEKYNANDALHWYTKDCFAYHVLNRAIRMKDIKILFQMGFFIRDINQQLEKIYSTTKDKSTLTVFRGQGMKSEYFEELKQNQGGLISFNGFLSTSVKQNVAREFAQQSLSNGFPVAVLFRMKIDPTNTSCPYASLENLSSNRSEYEILFSFKTIFQIETIEQIETNLWQVDLTLTNNKQNDLSQFIQIQSDKFNHLIDYEKLGELLIEMNELYKAKDLYEVNLPSISHPKYTYVYTQLALIYTKLEDYNQALLYYNIALGTKSNETLNDYVTISNIHNQIGKIYSKQDKFREALDKFQYALNIQTENLPPTDPSIAKTYDLLAAIYEENEDYETALEYHQKQLNIHEESLLTNQPAMASTHFKIAICLDNLDRSNEALDHAQQAIEMTRPTDPELNNRKILLEKIREKLD